MQGAGVYARVAAYVDWIFETAPEVASVAATASSGGGGGGGLIVGIVGGILVAAALAAVGYAAYAGKLPLIGKGSVAPAVRAV